MRHMFLRTTAVALAVCLLCSPVWAQTASRFEAQVQKLVEDDQKNPPADGSILFIGSSIWRLWTTLKEQMAPLPVYNRAFGGSRTPDMLEQFDRLVVPHKPRIIVYYCGSNDVGAGDEAAPIEDRIHQFIVRVGKALPGTKVIFVSINKAPDKEKRWDVVDAVNAKVRDEFTKEFNYVSYIDVNPALFDANGKARLDLYLPDKLHFHPPAYAAFTEIIKPILAREWGAK